MTFGSVFGRTFSPTFQPSSQAAAVASSWWLAGGIAAADCVAAYQPKGAASFDASKVNLTGDATYNLVGIPLTASPDFATATGYYYSGSKVGLNTSIPGNTKPVTVIARIVCAGYAANRVVVGGAAENGVFEYRLTTAQKQQTLVQGKTGIASSGTNVGTGDAVIAFSYSATGVYAFYLNGNADGTGTSDKSFTKSSGLAVGYAANGEYFYGYIYAVAFYSAALTQAQASSLSTAMNAL